MVCRERREWVSRGKTLLSSRAASHRAPVPRMVILCGEEERERKGRRGGSKGAVPCGLPNPVGSSHSPQSVH